MVGYGRTASPTERECRFPISSLSIPHETIRSGWIRISGRSPSRVSARPRTSIPRGRHGSVLARSSITIAARPLRRASRNFLVRAKSLPPTSIDSRSGLYPPPDLLEPARGREDQLRATVLRIGPALDVAKLLQLVDRSPDDLLVAAREASQVGRADPVLVEVSEYGAVPGVKVAVAGLREACEQLGLEREEQLAGEDTEVRIQFLPLPASFSGGHQL